MNLKQKEFQKYKTKGAYHWHQISKNPFRRNPFVLGRYLKIISIIKQHFGLPLEDKIVLDVGCGDGVLASMLSQQGFQSSGIDYSHEAIKFAKLKTKDEKKIDFVQGSAYALPWPDDTFDIIVSSEVIEHLTDISTFLKEMIRVVKTDGIIVISTPIRFTELPLDTEHVAEWFPSEFAALISEQMPNACFDVSHPVALMELQQSRFIFRVLMSLYSLVKNPFLQTNSRWRYFAIQYSVWKKLKV